MKYNILLKLSIGLTGVLLGYLLFYKPSNINQNEHLKNEGENHIWTCSMHPKVQLGIEGKCPLCGMDLVLASKENTGYSNNSLMQVDTKRFSSVETMVIKLDDSLTFELDLSGEIVTNKDSDAVQTTNFAGRLDSFSLNMIGERVKKGEVVGTIFSPDLYGPQDKLIVSKSYKESHFELYRTARNTGGLWKIPDSQIEKILNEENPVFDFPLISQYNGEVIEIYAEKGNFYKEGAPLYKISNLNTVWAILDIYERQLPLVKIGDSVILTRPGFEDTKMKAVIDLIEPIINKEQKISKARVVIQNANGFLRPGMVIGAKVEIKANSVIMVPKTAVIWTGKRSLLYKRNQFDNDSFNLIEIELGSDLGNKYEVLNGLEIGDEIVSDGVFEIDASAQLQGKVSMMNRSDPNYNHTSGRMTETKDLNKNDFSQNQKLGKEKNEFLINFMKNYISLKEAMVQGDLGSAKESLQNLDSQIFDTKGIFYNDRELTLHFEKLKVSKDIILLRKNFKEFNNTLIKGLKNRKDIGKRFFIQYCPMADNNKGAFWLSEQEAIRNPYYGDQMLSCGFVHSIIE